ncbi:hypothetical protein ACWEWI_39895 [Streptomyces sp. NPDC003753]
MIVLLDRGFATNAFLQAVDGTGADFLMGVEIVPDQHDRAAELLVGGLNEVAVVLPGEALATSTTCG